MPVKLRFSWTIIVCCGVLIMLTTGCGHRIELQATADSSPKPIVREIARDEQVPLVIDSVDTTRNGSPQNSSLETEHRVLGTLRGVGLFSRLGDMNSPEPPASEKFIRARLLFDEAIDSHSGDVAWKSIAIGASMFTLAPFIPLEYDYSAHVTLELERWDGRVKHYESRSAGTAHYKMFGATPLMIDGASGARHRFLYCEQRPHTRSAYSFRFSQVETGDIHVGSCHHVIRQIRSSYSLRFCVA